MSLKVFFLILLVVAIASTSCVEARRRSSSRSHKSTSHLYTNRHKTGRHQSENGHHTVGSDNHNSLTGKLNQKSQNTNIKNAASLPSDSTHNTNHPAGNTNVQHEDTKLSGNDFTAGYVAGSAAARRSRRRRTTTVAPTTTTKNPCSNDATVQNNNQLQNPAINCDSTITQKSSPVLSDLNQNSIGFES